MRDESLKRYKRTKKRNRELRDQIDQLLSDTTFADAHKTPPVVSGRRLEGT